MPAIVRDMTLADYAPAMALWQATEGVRSSETPEEIAAFLKRNPGLSLVTEDAGRLVAAVMGGHDGRRGYFYHMAVAPEYRRQGIARSMIEISLKRMAAQGIRRASAFVMTENGQGRQFWEQLGWWLRDDLVAMACDLPLAKTDDSQ